MKNLFLILLSVLFIFGCTPTEVITPSTDNTTVNTNNTSNSNVDGTIPVNYKTGIATVMNEAGDTVLHQVLDFTYEKRVEICTSTYSMLIDTMFYQRLNNQIRNTRPIGFSISFEKNTIPTVGKTHVKGSNYGYYRPLAVYCGFILEPNNEVWHVTGEDDYGTYFPEGNIYSNEITSVEDLGVQPITLAYSYEKTNRGGDITIKNDSVRVYNITGEFTKEFLQTSNRENTVTYKVTYELPLFLPTL